MANPTQSDLHVNTPLTNISIAYIQSSSNFIADKVFPKVSVPKQSDLYWKYSKSDWRRTDANRRAPSTESPGVGWKVTTDTYFAHVYAVHKDIDDQLRANADSNFSLDRDASTFVTNQLLLRRDIDWCNTYFKQGVWVTTLTGVVATPSAGQFVQWDQAGSDPILDLTNAAVAFREQTGYTPNTLTLGAYVLQVLRNHPDILDRIKYTQRGIVTEDLLATLFGVDKVLVAYASLASGPEIPDATAQDAAASYAFIADSKSALLSYAPSAPSLLTPSAGYTFNWNGYFSGNGQGLRIKTFRMEPIASDRVEGELTYDMRLVGRDMGIFYKQCIA
jgi:hypothetical protein